MRICTRTREGHNIQFATYNQQAELLGGQYLFILQTSNVAVLPRLIHILVDRFSILLHELITTSREGDRKCN